jgi:hypothetical protein
MAENLYGMTGTIGTNQKITLAVQRIYVWQRLGESG